MFKKVFIFFLLFFFFSTIKGSESFTSHEIKKIKNKVFDVNSSLNISRNKNLITKKEFTKTKKVFDSIKKQKWSNAKKIANKDKALEKLVDWYFLNQNKSPKFFQNTNNFIKENPNWPKITFLRKKNELFVGSNWNNSRIINLFDATPPLTTKGAVNYVDALRKKNGINSVIKLANDTWINKNFTKHQSKDFYKKYKKILRKKDHIERIEKLTWVGRNYEARTACSY